MKLLDADILEFQEMCKEHLGIELTWEAAQDQAIKLVRLMQITHQPMTIEEFEAVKQHDQMKDENEDEQDRPVADL